MDTFEVTVLAVGAGVVLVVALVVIFGKRMGGHPTGYIDPGGDSGSGGD